MRAAISEESFLYLPAEITPSLARSCAEKMNLLFQVQLLGQSVVELDSALELMLDLARDLVEHERAVILWTDDIERPLQVRFSQGFDDAVPLVLLRECFRGAESSSSPRPFLLSRNGSQTPKVGSLLQELGATSLLAMPLYAGERAMGSLVLIRRSPPPIRLEDAHLLRVYTLMFEPILDGLVHGARPKDYTFLDAATGLFTRRYLEQHLEREIDRARRNNEPLAMLLVEVEGFGKLRQERGRAAGQAALKEVSSKLQRVFRKCDTLARYDQDQFAVLLPRTGKDDIAVVVRRLLERLQGPLWLGQEESGGDGVSFNVSGVSYPDDVFSTESMLDLCVQGLDQARAAPGRHVYQVPARKAMPGEEEILDTVRTSLFREPLLEPKRLLQLFGRLCLDTVPADRVSIMVREGDSLVVWVAIGFEGQEGIVRGTKVPLKGSAVSSWVAQRREPLLVRGSGEWEGLERNQDAAYRGDSFFSYPLLAGDDLLGVIHFSNRSDGEAFTKRDLEAFEPLAHVMEQYLSLGQQFGRVQEGFLQQALFALIDLMERQIPGMSRHSEGVARLAEATARSLGYSDDEASMLGLTARLHDLGKVSYRARVLGDARALSPRERVMAQRHPLLGWKFLEGVPLERIDREAILYHHEREDGSGYFGRPGAETPETAKILAVADVFDAITSPRPYRPAVSKEEALSYLDRQKGLLFDARVVDALRSAVEANG